VFLLLGCPGEESGSATDGADPGTAGATSTTDASGTTGDATAATSEPTTGAAACEETTGEPVLHDELCDPFCQRLSECELGELFDVCPCYGLLTGEKCLAKWDGVVECFEAEACNPLIAGVSPCWVQFDAAIERCTQGECGCAGYEEVGGDIAPGECIFGEECFDSPSRRIECDPESCSCTVDGVPAGTCPANGVCDAEDSAVVDARLDECCG
jgi:hypothetical protein